MLPYLCPANDPIFEANLIQQNMTALTVDSHLLIVTKTQDVIPVTGENYSTFISLR